MNMFLKGLHTFPHIVERIINKSLTDYYDLKDKTILVVKNQQLLRAIKNSSTTTPFSRWTSPRDTCHPTDGPELTPSEAGETWHNSKGKSEPMGTWPSWDKAHKEQHPRSAGATTVTNRVTSPRSAKDPSGQGCTKL